MGRLFIRFNEEQVSEPIASQIIIEYKVPMAILSAHINNKGGEILVEVPDEMEAKVAEAFRKRGINVSVPKLIEVDSDKCFSCGTCIALCPVEAINTDKDYTVQFDKEKCLGSTCSICVDACPARAIKSIKPNGNGNDQPANGRVKKA
ncbi:MAG TPA: 4Fe-4S dicluster domain-containing protein [Candidatus Acidoferrales bacterium]|nr:4Fe-4S dicluster domain-containing protein [Candidatus Acidoferrales bacterium]